MTNTELRQRVEQIRRSASTRIPLLSDINYEFLTKLEWEDYTRGRAQVVKSTREGVRDCLLLSEYRHHDPTALYSRYRVFAFKNPHKITAVTESGSDALTRHSERMRAARYPRDIPIYRGEVSVTENTPLLSKEGSQVTFQDIWEKDLPSSLTCGFVRGESPQRIIALMLGRVPSKDVSLDEWEVDGTT